MELYKVRKICLRKTDFLEQSTHYYDYPYSVAHTSSTTSGHLEQLGFFVIGKLFCWL